MQNFLPLEETGNSSKQVFIYKWREERERERRREEREKRILTHPLSLLLSSLYLSSSLSPLPLFFLLSPPPKKGNTTKTKKWFFDELCSVTSRESHFLRMFFLVFPLFLSWEDVVTGLVARWAPHTHTSITLVSFFFFFCFLFYFILFLFLFNLIVLIFIYFFFLSLILFYFFQINNLKFSF